MLRIPKPGKAEPHTAPKAIVFAFGRFTPPTIGHAMLINKVVSWARSIGADNRIYTSASFDSARNPIPFADKVAFLKALFPQAHINSDKSAASIHQIAKQLTKEGYTNVTLIVGSDRISEFKDALGKYVVSPSDKKFDKSKHYPWKKFEIVSAGERDPDAEGVTGASGTKMREYVRNDDFKSFMSNVPTENMALARKIFMTVKRNLLKEGTERPILEGCNDRSIFKAVFLAGGPGSGKDFISNRVLKGYGLVEINSDTAFEFLMKKERLNFHMPDHDRQERDLVRGRAKNMTKEKERLALTGRLGLIINSTGDDFNQTDAIKRNLENIGYECRLLYVDTSNEVSRARNQMRGSIGGRVVPEAIRQDKWLAAHHAGKHYVNLFGEGQFDIVSNDLDLAIAPEEVKKEKEEHLLRLFKKFRKWASHRPTNAVCLDWLSKGGNLVEIYNLGVTKYNKSTEINEDFTEIFKVYKV